MNQQVGDEVGNNVVSRAAADQEAGLARFLGLLGNDLQVFKGGNFLGSITGVSNQLLVVQHDGHVAEEGCQIDVVIHLADGGGSRDDVIIEAIAHLAEVCQHVVLGELGHPGAVHHAQVIGAGGVHGIQCNAGVQIVEGQFLHIDLHIVLRLKVRQSGLQGFRIGAAPQDQGHVGRFIGGSGVSGSTAVGRRLGLAAAAGGQ